MSSTPSSKNIECSVVYLISLNPDAVGGTYDDGDDDVKDDAIYVEG